MGQTLISFVQLIHKVVTKRANVVGSYTLLFPKYLSIGLDWTYPKLRSRRIDSNFYGLLMTFDTRLTKRSYVGLV